MQGPGHKKLKNKKRANFEGPSTSTSKSALAYPHRLNFYTVPPQLEITLDQFEQWAIDRLRVLGEIESCLFRNKNPKELESAIKPLLDKYLPLSSNAAIPSNQASNPKASNPVQEERKKDHYSHFILKLAFARSEDLRRRFARAEDILFRMRFTTDDAREKQAFLDSLDLDWEVVSDEEKTELGEKLRDSSGSGLKKEGGLEGESFFKVDWERVPDLIQDRKVFLRYGKAYVPMSMQLSLVMAEFSSRMEKTLEQTARTLPRLDEDDRIIPILNHLSLGFEAPEYNTQSATTLDGTAITAASIDGLSVHFPLCMKNLHSHLRRDKHLKHFARLQFGLFIKGIGLSVEEALVFWRTAFSTKTDDQFTKDYRYNIRHSYGLEGNRRNYKPYNCQQILTEHPPGNNDLHGCPYRHFKLDNLIATLNDQMGLNDKQLISGIKHDKEQNKFHLACNRVFEYVHEKELKRDKLDGGMSGVAKETITHPNEYFDRSFKLKVGKVKTEIKEEGPRDVEMKTE